MATYGVLLTLLTTILMIFAPTVWSFCIKKDHLCDDVNRCCIGTCDRQPGHRWGVCRR